MAWPPPDAATLAGSAARPVPRRGQLTTGWRAVLVIGWVLVTIGLMTTGGGSVQLGKPAWWIANRALVPIPFLLPMAVLFLGVRNLRGVLPVAGLATLGLGATALLDITPSPGSAFVEGGLALAALLLTVAALAGRTPRGSE